MFFVKACAFFVIFDRFIDFFNVFFRRMLTNLPIGDIINYSSDYTIAHVRRLFNEECYYYQS